MSIPINVTTSQFIAEEDGRLVGPAQQAMLTGSWLLTLLALAGVVGIVAGRVAGQRRRVGLLKAVGAGPAMVAAVHLTEYLVIALAGAGSGLVAGWLAAPVLTRPGAGLVGSVGAPPPALHTVVAATVLALAIALATWTAVLDARQPLAVARTLVPRPDRPAWAWRQHSCSPPSPASPPGSWPASC